MTDTTTAAALQDTLKAHGVSVEYVRPFTGPTVTQHAFSLASGVPLKKVIALSKDLALAVGLSEVRIVAPIPGTSYVGIEVPNEHREVVGYGDLDGTGFAAPEHVALPMPVGVDISNDEIWADLVDLPHLLIAGTTGSGKSTALNAIITSLIEHRAPDVLRIYGIDPKRVELAPFAAAPQVEEIVSDIPDAIRMLEDIVAEMDRRYREFENLGVRNITEFNVEGEEITPGEGPLPYIVVVVDELADLMMTSAKQAEPLIVRIAQLGRAAGLHLVLATQRPTVDVVTGLIKANVPSRWAFSVATGRDSMVILDQPGAEALYGKGDSLWAPAGTTKPVRVQAVYADDDTISTLVAEALVYGPVETITGSDADDGTSPVVDIEGLDEDLTPWLERVADDHPNARFINAMVDAEKDVSAFLDDGDFKHLAHPARKEAQETIVVEAAPDVLEVLENTPTRSRYGRQADDFFPSPEQLKIPAGTVGHVSYTGSAWVIEGPDIEGPRDSSYTSRPDFVHGPELQSGQVDHFTDLAIEQRIEAAMAKERMTASQWVVAIGTVAVLAGAFGGFVSAMFVSYW